MKGLSGLLSFKKDGTRLLPSLNIVNIKKGASEEDGPVIEKVGVCGKDQVRFAVGKRPSCSTQRLAFAALAVTRPP